MASPAALHVLSPCAGVGGLDLGLAAALEPCGLGSRVVCHVEREASAAAILAARMEEKSLDVAPVWSDLRTFDGRPWRGVVDCLTAGYPCQPFSNAGLRLGHDDPRHLWPWVDHAIGECGPRFVFLENVAAHLRLGFGTVRRDLQRRGYRVQAGLFSAAEVGASHRRERLFILAHLPGKRSERRRLPERQARPEQAAPHSDGVVAGVGEFNPRCCPPWSLADLRHKVRSAASARSAKPCGYLLTADDQGFIAAAKPTKEERAWQKKLARDAETAKRARLLLPKRLIEYAWPLAEILVSPGAYRQDPADGWRELLHLFEREDVVWIGDTWGSGQPCYDALFRTAAEWLRLPSCPAGPLICASTFRPGTYQRCRDQVVRTPFLVVESDTLTFDQIGAVFLWLHAACGVPLRAIIGTGGKSLHGWFDQPLAGSRRDDLLVSLKAMGCDPKPWSEPAMSRCPSAFRRLTNGATRRQRLLWINPMGGRVEGVCHSLRA